MSRRAPVEPRMLSRDQAASYCGLSLRTFKAVCPVAPVRMKRRVLYDKRQIDGWLDRPEAVEKPGSHLRVVSGNPWDE